MFALMTLYAIVDFTFATLAILSDPYPKTVLIVYLVVAAVATLVIFVIFPLLVEKIRNNKKKK